MIAFGAVVAFESFQFGYSVSAQGQACSR
jgi:hypothetical protein